MAEMKHLTILQFNDTHAYLDLHPELFLEAGEESYRNAGGYARIATLFKEIREENPEAVLALDNGDTFHGTYAAVKSKGEDLVPLVNALELDGMTGHWDFAYGPAKLEEINDGLNHPMLAANCYDEETDELVYPPYTIVERGGLKIGVIGLAATIIDKVMPPHFSEGIRFTMGNEELPRHIEHLRDSEGVDLIVVLSHLGFPQEIKLASEVDGIDVLLSGHTHNRLFEPAIVNDAIVMQSGCHGSFIGRLDVEMEDGKVSDYRHSLIPVEESIEPDEEVQKQVDKVLEPHREFLDTIVGHTDTALNRNSQLEATMDNFLLQALIDASGAELAFSNGWRYGAPVLPGPVTVNDLWNIIPPNPPVSLVELTGAELLEMMEENLERTFCCDPYGQMGGYVKRCLGMTVYVKIENPPGLRIQQFFVGDEPLDRERTYTASFVTMQGVPKKYGSDRRNLDVHAIEAMKQYLSKHDSVSAELRNTVVAV